MGPIETAKLQRQLLGASTMLFLYQQTNPDLYHQQIAEFQQTLSTIIHSLIGLGGEGGILPSIGPLLLRSLLRSLPFESDLAGTIEQLQFFFMLEDENKIPLLGELIPKFDNIIVLLGKRASGKGTIGNILATEYVITGIPASDWLRAIAAARNYPEPFDPVMLRELGDELRNEFGGDVLVWLALLENNLKGHNRAVFDGLRLEKEIKPLLNQPNVTFIWIDAPSEIRLARLKNRQRGGDPTTIEELLAVDVKTFPEADNLRGNCHYIIENPTDDMSSLGVKVETIMTGLAIPKTKINTLPFPN